MTQISGKISYVHELEDLILLNVHANKVMYRFNAIPINIPMVVLFLIVLEFELRDLQLLGRYSTTWATPSAHFALHILKIGS
jgi:hypothetical protein